MWPELQREERIIVTDATAAKAAEVFFFFFFSGSGLELKVFRVSHENLWKFILVLNAPKNALLFVKLEQYLEQADSTLVYRIEMEQI